MLQQPCGIIIKRITNLLSKDADNSLREKNLTFLQMHSLMLLLKEEGETMTLKELEKALQVSQPDAAGIVVRLEKKGLVACSIDESDKRVKRFKITELGKECCRNAKKHMQRAEDSLLSGMTEAEKKEFRRLLELALNNLSR